MMDGFMRLLIWLGLAPQQNIFYIGGTDILPAPLKGTEEQTQLEALEKTGRHDLIGFGKHCLVRPDKGVPHAEKPGQERAKGKQPPKAKKRVNSKKCGKAVF